MEDGVSLFQEALRDNGEPEKNLERITAYLQACDWMVQ